MTGGDCNVVIMSSIASIESELRNRLSSLPRFSLRGHPLSCYPKSKGDICPSPYDFYAFPSISFVFPMAFVVWGAFPSRFLMRFLTRAYMRAFPGISTFLLSQPSHASYFKLEKSGFCSHVKPVQEISRLRPFSRRDCEVVKICPKSACYDLIQRTLCGNLWRMWKQKGINCSGARARARARREDGNTF